MDDAKENINDDESPAEDKSSSDSHISSCCSAGGVETSKPSEIRMTNVCRDGRVTFNNVTSASPATNEMSRKKDESRVEERLEEEGDREGVEWEEKEAQPGCCKMKVKQLETPTDGDALCLSGDVDDTTSVAPKTLLGLDEDGDTGALRASDEYAREGCSSADQKCVVADIQSVYNRDVNTATQAAEEEACSRSSSARPSCYTATSSSAHRRGRLSSPVSAPVHEGKKNKFSPTDAEIYDIEHRRDDVRMNVVYDDDNDDGVMRADSMRNDDIENDSKFKSEATDEKVSPNVRRICVDSKRNSNRSETFRVSDKKSAIITDNVKREKDTLKVRNDAADKDDGGIGFGESHVNKLMSFVDSLERLEQSTSSKNNVEKMTSHSVASLAQTSRIRAATTTPTTCSSINSTRQPGIFPLSEQYAAALSYTNSGTDRSHVIKQGHVATREQPLDLSLNKQQYQSGGVGGSGGGVRGGGTGRERDVKLGEKVGIPITSSFLSSLEALSRSGASTDSLHKLFPVSDPRDSYLHESQSTLQRPWATDSIARSAPFPENYAWPLASSFASIQAQMEAILLSYPLFKASIEFYKTLMPPPAPISGTGSSDAWIKSVVKNADDKMAAIHKISPDSSSSSKIVGGRIRPHDENSSDSTDFQKRHKIENARSNNSRSSPAEHHPSSRNPRHDLAKISRHHRSRRADKLVSKPSVMSTAASGSNSASKTTNSTLSSYHGNQSEKCSPTTSSSDNRKLNSESNDITADERRPLTSLSCSCGRQFETLYHLTVHTEETGHRLSRVKKDSADDFPKLVRGQDLWLSVGQKQAQRTLQCMRCQESFQSLPELTMHMVRTRHYVDIVGCREDGVTDWNRLQPIVQDNDVNSPHSPPTLVERHHRHHPVAKHLKIEEKHNEDAVSEAESGLSTPSNGRCDSEDSSSNHVARNDSPVAGTKSMITAMNVTRSVYGDYIRPGSSSSLAGFSKEHETGEASSPASVKIERKIKDGLLLSGNKNTDDCKPTVGYENDTSAVKSALKCNCKETGVYCRCFLDPVVNHTSRDDAKRRQLEDNTGTDAVTLSAKQSSSPDVCKKQKTNRGISEEYQKQKCTVDMPKKKDIKSYRDNDSIISGGSRKRSLENDGDIELEQKVGQQITGDAGQQRKRFMELVRPAADLNEDGSSSTLKAMESFVERSFSSSSVSTQLLKFPFLQSRQINGINNGDYSSTAIQPTKYSASVAGKTESRDRNGPWINTPPKMVVTIGANMATNNQQCQSRDMRDRSPVLKQRRRSKIKLEPNAAKVISFPSTSTSKSDGLLMIKPRNGDVTAGHETSDKEDSNISTNSASSSTLAAMATMSRLPDKNATAKSWRSSSSSPPTLSALKSESITEEERFSNLPPLLHRADTDTMTADEGRKSDERASHVTSVTSSTLEYLQQLVDETSSLSSSSSKKGRQVPLPHCGQGSESLPVRLQGSAEPAVGKRTIKSR